jgi:regulatory protein
MSDPDADLYAEVRDKALKLLTRREHSRSELQQKLFQRGFEDPLIEQVLSELCARNQLSDSRYAQALVSHRAKTGYGPEYIRQELRARNVDPLIIDEALAGADWARRASYLQRRGFDMETIRQVLGEWQSPG